MECFLKSDTDESFLNQINCYVKQLSLHGRLASTFLTAYRSVVKIYISRSV